MRAKILRLEKKLFDGEIMKAVLPAAAGEMCLLPRHISIMTPLKKGVVKVFTPDSESPVCIEISGGLCSFSENTATIIADSAATAAE